MQTIEVTSNIKNYNIFIDKKLANLLNKSFDLSKKYFVIYDNNIPTKFTDFFFKNKSFKCYGVNGGECAKSIDEYTKIVSFMLNESLGKDIILVALGGGTITDLVGYIASTYKRGIDYINIPTTTLAMIDASIGGKNALNVGDVKNSIGTIYPPTKVLIGIDTLNSLAKKHFNNGLFEALKIAILFDKKLFEDIKNKKYECDIENIILQSILLKRAIIQKDEMDKGERKLLNYGHSIGHALEVQTNFELLHGEAVANGILMLSKKEPFYNELNKILEELKCPIIKNLQVNELIQIIKNDKKTNSEKLDEIFVSEIGKPVIRKIDINTLKEILN